MPGHRDSSLFYKDFFVISLQPESLKKNYILIFSSILIRLFLLTSMMNYYSRATGFFFLIFFTLFFFFDDSMDIPQAQPRTIVRITFLERAVKKLLYRWLF